MRAHNTFRLAFAAAGLAAMTACSSGDVTGPAVDAERQLVIGGGLINVQLTDFLNDLTVDVDVRDNNVAVQVCAIVELLDADFGDDDVTCDITQTAGGGGANAQLVGPIVIGGGLVNVQVTDFLNDLEVNIDVSNNNVAAQVCAAVEVLNVELNRPEGDQIECTITQN